MVRDERQFICEVVGKFQILNWAFLDYIVGKYKKGVRIEYIIYVVYDGLNVVCGSD